MLTKVALALWLLAGLLVPGLAIEFTRCEPDNQSRGVTSPEGCKICIEFADKALNTLLNLILGKWAWLQLWQPYAYTNS